jgi:isoquinoline 1-oxidoreductase subunit beta
MTMNLLSRRRFLQSSALTGASLVIAFAIRRPAQALLAGPPKQPRPPPNAFLRISPDESVTVLLAHSEMGQGIWTTLPMLVAEELECDWSRVRVEHAPAAPVYAHTADGVQVTGGSSSTWSEFDRYRIVGAMARQMLVQAAAAEWKTRPDRLRVESGYVIDGPRRLSFGQLAERARSVPAPSSVKLKPAQTWTLLGKPHRRLDTPEKITGRAQYGIDIHFPELRTTLVARTPVFGGKLKSFDATAARAVPGVEQVVQVPSGVAVIATNTWAARQGRSALKLDWDLGPGAGLDSEKIREEYRALARTPGAVAAQAGDPDLALRQANRRVEAQYELPYLAHAPMEPLNCAVKLEADRCDIWIGTHFQTMDQQLAAKTAGLRPEQVHIHTPFLGGSFGRRSNPACDVVVEAVEVAKAGKVPVKVVWTREDDIRGGYYRPAYLHRIEAGLDGEGLPVAWKHTIVGQSILTGTAFEAEAVTNGIDPSSVSGVTDSPYLSAVPTRRVMLHSPRSPIPVLWWRSVGNSHTAFAVESMVDELAATAGRDPLDYRSWLLRKHRRHQQALQLAAEKAGWGHRAPEGRALGMAMHESFGSIIAQVAEVSVESENRIRVHRVTCAVDCGFAVNPIGVEAQIQSAVAFGLGAVLHSAITFKEGRVQQGNFDDYQVLRMDEMPKVDVHIIKSRAKMGGIGEPGTAPIAPAVANAVFALTKRRLRSLPLQLA